MLQPRDQLFARAGPPDRSKRRPDLPADAATPSSGSHFTTTPRRSDPAWLHKRAFFWNFRTSSSLSVMRSHPPRPAHTAPPPGAADSRQYRKPSVWRQRLTPDTPQRQSRKTGNQALHAHPTSPFPTPTSIPAPLRLFLRYDAHGQVGPSGSPRFHAPARALAHGPASTCLSGARGSFSHAPPRNLTLETDSPRRRCETLSRSEPPIQRHFSCSRDSHAAPARPGPSTSSRPQ